MKKLIENMALRVSNPQAGYESRTVQLDLAVGESQGIILVTPTAYQPHAPRITTWEFAGAYPAAWCSCPLALTRVSLAELLELVNDEMGKLSPAELEGLLVPNHLSPARTATH